MGDIVATADGAGTFKTLLAAATAAGLVETLQGEGPFTVFAPTDEAFAALPAGTLDSLLADPEALKKILLYHVVSGAVTADQVVGLTSADSVEGSPIAIAVKDGKVYLNDTAQVTATDVMASNGVIHVIDQVILPPAELTRSLPSIPEGWRPVLRGAIPRHPEDTPMICHQPLHHRPAGRCPPHAPPPCAAGTSASDSCTPSRASPSWPSPPPSCCRSRPPSWRARPARRPAHRPPCSTSRSPGASPSSCSCRPASTGWSPRRASSAATSRASRPATTTSAGRSTRSRRRS